ncbi:Uncharacterised protein [Mesomycoplasma conjunctivae]|uniref:HYPOTHETICAL Uncharacterized protein UU050 n=1 Tax=Mesomycoplasma conjunctivae (strain ATCC 25834 / NCTC 10147 / HRC/581) TaxID=572263 RepID=C5J6E0_MESCH|nr:hypothetical protein [Mesomycoplasma conjunctivae]CAT05032.1 HYPOTHETICAL Uncharacterized protein UU050 [Mesomycoplasma conjunctivae]VEU66310.1 Uncharacterised protein [Mesomycoplasma conjunctivae]
MNLNEKKEKLVNFKKIYDLVTLNRNISLIQINQLLKNIKMAHEFFLIGQFFLNKYDDRRNKTQYFLSNLKQKLTKQNKKTLWIYPSSDEKYTQNFFDQIEQIILDNWQEGDQIITIGSKANEFAKKHNFEHIEHYKDFKQLSETSKEIAAYINFSIKNNLLKAVKVAIYSNKVDNHIANIFPLNQFEFKLENNNTNLEKVVAAANDFKFFPNFDEFYQSQLEIYFSSACHILFLESQFIVYKNKLIHENSLLKEIEEKTQKLKTTILKIERELEIEELNLIKPKSRGVI